MRIEGSYKAAYLAGVDVAFNNRIEKLKKVSYDGAIDVQYGIYLDEPYRGCFSINFKPSKQGVDWWYNLRGLPKKTDEGNVHKGYYKEIEKYWLEIKKDIINIVSKYQFIDLSKGIVLAGRSKGAGEALLLIPHMAELGPIKLCMAIEPPKVCDYDYGSYLWSLCNMIMTTSYKNDIVTGIPPWFKYEGIHFQNGKRKLGLSIKDHEEATTKEQIWYDFIKELEK